MRIPGCAHGRRIVRWPGPRVRVGAAGITNPHALARAQPPPPRTPQAPSTRAGKWGGHAAGAWQGGQGYIRLPCACPVGFGWQGLTTDSMQCQQRKCTSCVLNITHFSVSGHKLASSENISCGTAIKLALKRSHARGSLGALAGGTSLKVLRVSCRADQLVPGVPTQCGAGQVLPVVFVAAPWSPSGRAKIQSQERALRW